MRDRRFIARHRGGPLDPAHHRLLARWAADCAARVLPLFAAAAPDDDRPRLAIDLARTWSHGNLPVGPAQRAAQAAHAAARSLTAAPAIAAARAAGHAVATAHAADHSLGAAYYALKALLAAGRNPARERAWQLAHLPAPLRDLVSSALAHPRFHLPASPNPRT